jgi:site-specific DNA-adenine methylase
MINDPKPSKGIYDYAEQIKETSILRHYDKEKPLTKTLTRKDFLFCDPPEVIIQSKHQSNNFTYNRH